MMTGTIFDTRDLPGERLRRAVWRIVDTARNVRIFRAECLNLVVDEADALSAFGSDEGYTVRDVMSAAGGVATLTDADDLRAAASSWEDIQEPARRLAVELLRVPQTDTACILLLALLLDLRRAGFDGDADALCAVVREMSDRATQRQQRGAA